MLSNQAARCIGSVAANVEITTFITGSGRQTSQKASREYRSFPSYAIAKKKTGSCSGAFFTFEPYLDVTRVRPGPADAAASKEASCSSLRIYP